jgi:hypothetical protein
MDRDRIAASRREIKELADAWGRRHLFRRGTPDGIPAPKLDERLASRIRRRLRADSAPVSPLQTGD